MLEMELPIKPNTANHDMMSTSGLHVGVVFWKEGDGLALSISGTLEQLGCVVTNFVYDGRLPEEIDVILAYGPLNSLVPLTNQLLSCPASKRPPFALWLTEQLPNPALPEWIRYSLGVMRSQAERLAFREHAQGEWQLDQRLQWLVVKGHRLRYYGDLHTLYRLGILSVLAVGSQWIADFLQVRGLNPITAFIGSNPDWWADLGLERDIPVLWIGKTGTVRRKRFLERVRVDLMDRGLDVLMIDGVENPYVFGEDRTILLNRTKIVLNILRTKWDNHSLRYFLAAPNRAMVVTEPTLPHTPFLPGEHLVEAPVERLADTICHYLVHEEERRQIADQAYQLVRTDLTMRNSVARILEQVSSAKDIKRKKQ
jgi:hypothetical protein